MPKATAKTQPKVPVPPTPPERPHGGMMKAGFWLFFFLFLVTLVALVAVLVTQVPSEMEDDAMIMEEEFMMEEDVLEEAMMEEETMMTEGRFSEIYIRTVDDDLYGYAGVAELEGYYIVSEEALGLGVDVPTTECAAFIVTDGAQEAMRFIQNREARTGQSKIILGELDDGYDSVWWNTPDITESSEDNPVNAIFRIGSTFEGEAIGCFDGQVDLIATVN